VSSSATDPRPQRRSSGRWRALQVLAGVALGVALVVIAIDLRSQARHAEGVLPVLRRADARLLVAAVSFEVASYLAPGALLRLLVGELPYRTSLRIAVAALGVGALLPGQPAPGAGIAYRECRRRGVAAGRATRASALLMVGVPAASMMLLAGPALVTSALLAALPAGWNGVVWAAAGLSLVLGAATLYVLVRPSALQGGAGEGRIARLLAHLGGRRRFATALGLGIVAWVADALSLVTVAAALDVRLPAAAIPLAYVTSAVIAALPFVPGGLGGIEVTLPLVFSAAGGSYADAVLVVLAWRVISYWVPTMAGLVALVSLNRRQPAAAANLA
jgi:putative heme transporter